MEPRIMAIDFPNSPATNQTHTVGGKTWTYDGEKWVVVDKVNNASNQIYDVTVLLRMETN
jgi:hypothetical protein